MADVRIVATGLGFPEGPVAMQDGSVILTEIRNRRVSRITPDGTVTTLSDTGGGPNGLALGPDGALYGCNNGGSRYVAGSSMGQGPLEGYTHGWIERIDAKTGETRHLYTEAGGNRLSAPNDLVFDEHGGFYFTDLGKRYARHRDHGGLYYALPDGSKVMEIAYPILSPNGCGLSPDNRTLYVADTESARLWAFEIVSPGVVKKDTTHAAHGGRLVGQHRRPCEVRQPGGDRQRQYLCRHVEHRPHHGVLAAGRGAGASEDAGCLSDQYLLWRGRPANRLYHAVG